MALNLSEVGRYRDARLRLQQHWHEGTLQWSLWACGALLCAALAAWSTVALYRDDHALTTLQHQRVELAQVPLSPTLAASGATLAQSLPTATANDLLASFDEAMRLKPIRVLQVSIKDETSTSVESRRQRIDARIVGHYRDGKAALKHYLERHPNGAPERMSWSMSSANEVELSLSMLMLTQPTSTQPSEPDAK